MKLTKLQRYTAYVIMLNEFDSREIINQWGKFRCICYLAGSLFDLDINGDVGCEKSDDSFIDCFPEILKHRPKYFEHGRWWFTLDEIGYEKRREIFRQCILETHPDNN